MPTQAIAQAVMQSASQGLALNQVEVRSLMARIYRLESALEQINEYAVKANLALVESDPFDPFNDAVGVLLNQIQAAQRRVAE